MTEDLQGRQRKRKRLWLALAAIVVLLAVLIVPPLVSISRYKSRITQLISTSLGRPVRLSSVELRLLPRPGFVLYDLVVDEDPAYGYEPVLHANSVTASIRLLSLWRGHLEIGAISMDEASLNLVRTPAGRWNLDSIFRKAATSAQPAANGAAQKRAIPLPYFEATNSRINIKSGSEKLPFSLVDTDLSFWQENPGDWRVRLRGQPARTDLSLEEADTGIVRLEASMRPAPELRLMPLHVDLEWREAQLGQLTRLVAGTDAGWRGDLTGQLQMDGTAEAAHIQTRLRAKGVHRADVDSSSSMDFDANCGFVYHFSARSVENLSCDSPLGDGHIRLTGELPGELAGAAAQPRLSVALDKIPVAAGLDALRTLRSGFAPGLEAKGTISGKLDYAQPAPVVVAKPHAAKLSAAAPNPLTGNLTVDGFELSGGALTQPLQIPKILFEPAMASLASDAPLQSAKKSAQTPPPTQQPVLAATVLLPAGAPLPLTITSRLATSGYLVALHGQASVARGRELAHALGVNGAAALDNLAGEPIAIDLSADGPWMQAETTPFSNASIASADRIVGTISLRNTNWKSDYLANHVEISQATLHLDGKELRWEPVLFSYGPVKGSATLDLPADCDPSQPCTPSFHIDFASLDSSVVQTAFLGAHERGTMLSTLIDRLHPVATPPWPLLEGTIKVDSLLLGPVTLRQATATLHIVGSGAQITALDATLLGGRLHATGSFQAAVGDQGKPAYSFDASFEKLSPSSVGPLVSQHWSGKSFDANGKVDLSGFTEKDLAASAKGALHFDWRNGTASGALPASLNRFDHWTADAAINNGAITLGQNQVERGARKDSVQAAAILGAGAKLTFAPAPAPAKR